VEAAAYYGLRMVVRRAPHAGVYRPRLCLPGYSSPWSTFYSVRTHPGRGHCPNVPKQTRFTTLVNRSGFLHQKSPHPNRLCLAIRIMHNPAPTASQGITLDGAVRPPSRIRKQTKTKRGSWRTVPLPVTGSVDTARISWLSELRLHPVVTSAKSLFAESGSQRGAALPQSVPKT